MVFAPFVIIERHSPPSDRCLMSSPDFLLSLVIDGLRLLFPAAHESRFPCPSPLASLLGLALTPFLVQLRLFVLLP